MKWNCVSGILIFRSTLQLIFHWFIDGQNFESHITSHNNYILQLGCCFFFAASHCSHWWENVFNYILHFSKSENLYDVSVLFRIKWMGFHIRFEGASYQRGEFENRFRIIWLKFILEEITYLPQIKLKFLNPLEVDINSGNFHIISL